MSGRFDAYQKWLGIPPDQQPPNPYRLLGIELFEADRDTIDNAADRQMAHVRGFQAGQFSEISQQLLNEISTARVKLLNPQQKAAIDAELRVQTALPVARPIPAGSPPSAAPPAAAPRPAPTPLVDTSGGRVQRVARRKKQSAPVLAAQVAGGGILAVALTMFVPWWLFGADPFGLARTVPESAAFIVPASLREDEPPPEPPPPADNDTPPPDGRINAEKNPFENVIGENQLSPQARGAAGQNAGSDPFKLPGAPN